jgi:serine/threonine protein kinase
MPDQQREALIADKQTEGQIDTVTIGRFGKRQLPRGSKNSVYVIKGPEGNQLVAKIPRLSAMSGLRDELDILNKLHSTDSPGEDNIQHVGFIANLCVSFCCCSTTYEDVYFTQFYPGGSLTSRGFSDITPAHFLQLVDALNFLRAQNVVHGDVNPDKVLFDQQGKAGRVKLCNFSSAMADTAKKGQLSKTGTAFLAPELLERVSGQNGFTINNDINFSTDMYALALTLVYMLTQWRFGDADVKKAKPSDTTARLEAIANGLRPDIDEVKRKTLKARGEPDPETAEFHEKLYNILPAMWSRKHEERMHISDLQVYFNPPSA